MTSIRDVARRAGVSTATVSHILNETRFVSSETRQKVLDAIYELDYYPSKLARGLASNKSQTIGVVFSDIANMHFTQVFKGIEKFYSSLGYDLILANTSEDARIQENVLASMLSRSVDGLIIAPSAHPSEKLRLMKSKGLPVVLVDRCDPEFDLPMVGVNNQQAAYQAAAHLISDGHSRVGVLLGLKNISTTTERMDGFLKAFEDAGIPQDTSLFYWGESSQESGFRGAKELITRASPPSAIFCMNNLMTLGALHALRSLGLKCPQDVGLIGFDDHDWADIFTPPLTVVNQPTQELGTAAAELLHRQINSGPTTLAPQRFNLEARLIIRGSCSTACEHRYSKRGEEIVENEKQNPPAKTL